MRIHRARACLACVRRPVVGAESCDARLRQGDARERRVVPLRRTVPLRVWYVAVSSPRRVAAQIEILKRCELVKHAQRQCADRVFVQVENPEHETSRHQRSPGQKTHDEKYMHLRLLRAYVFVHTQTPTYNLRHSARKHFNTQIHTQACMPAYTHTRLTTLETLPARAQKV